METYKELVKLDEKLKRLLWLKSEIINKHTEYINMLIDELTEVIPIASSHGWISSRYEDGVKVREEIETLGKELSVQADKFKDN